MKDKKIEILKLMKGLPQDMIDDYELCEILPIPSETIDILCKKIFKCTCCTVGYTKNIIIQVDSFYNKFNSAKL